MKFEEIIKYKTDESKEIANIIIEANKNTIIAQIGKNFITNIFLKQCISSKNINVFVVKNKDKQNTYASIHYIKLSLEL